MTSYLRAWDLRSSRHVDTYLANSSAVARRIRRHYGRDAQVVYSPIDVDYFKPDGGPREDYYLMVSALVPYKRVDQAIAACAKLGRPLRIIGTGPEMPRLRQSLPANVRLMGWQSDATILEHYRRCRALLMPGEEDFGLVPLEAMACGAPVIAYKAGGALETVLDIASADAGGATGLLYTPPTVEGLIEAIQHYESIQVRFVPEQLVSWAHQFSAERFIREFKQALRPLLVEKGLREPWSNATTS
jgi:glycosyltransferase involved in cell wall biosynthesis